MSLYKNSLELMSEACKTECGTDDDVESLTLDDTKADVDDMLGDADEVDDDELGYTEEAVNLFNSPRLNCVLVEMDNLAKYMITNKITDISEALTNVAEHYEIDPATLAVVVESDEYISELIEEARSVKKEFKSKTAQDAKSMPAVLKMLKVKGIRVVKRKGRKKKARK